MIHNRLVKVVNGWWEFLEVDGGRIPGNALFEAASLECQLFSGYEPGFEGD
jgi:hypothetical protein